MLAPHEITEDNNTINQVEEAQPLLPPRSYQKSPKFSPNWKGLLYQFFAIPFAIGAAYLALKAYTGDKKASLQLAAQAAAAFGTMSIADNLIFSPLKEKFKNKQFLLTTLELLTTPAIANALMYLIRAYMEPKSPTSKNISSAITFYIILELTLAARRITEYATTNKDSKKMYGFLADIATLIPAIYCASKFTKDPTLILMGSAFLISIIVLTAVATVIQALPELIKTTGTKAKELVVTPILNKLNDPYYGTVSQDPSITPAP